MNKQELIANLSKETKMTKTAALSFTDAFVGIVSRELKKGREVKLVGFGTWKRINRKARTGRNPQTGERLKINARKVAKFVMGSDLFESLN